MYEGSFYRIGHIIGYYHTRTPMISLGNAAGVGWQIGCDARDCGPVVKRFAGLSQKYTESVRRHAPSENLMPL